MRGTRIRTVIASGTLVAVAFVGGTFTAAPSATASDTAVRFAYAGDSHTSGSSSWLRQMDDPSIIDVGGFAAPGYTSGQVLANIEAAPDADVLVIMVGTNDVRLGVNPYTTRDNIDAIAAKVGAARVLLVGTPPINSTNYRGIDRRTKGYVLNRYLIKIAAYRGWMYADPFANYRGYNNAWLSGRSADGTHPTAAASAYAAARMETYIRQTFEGAS